jgi:hypothetical protein
MNIYLFIAELKIDVKRARELLRGYAKIRKQKFEEIYKIKTELDLTTIINILKEGIDLHYIFQSINTINEFTGNRNMEI